MIQEYANIVDHLHVSIAPALIAGGSALLKGIGGLIQSAKGSKMLRGLKDPGYQIPEEFKTNLAQAEQAARQGIPAQEYNLATTNIQRGTQAGLRQLGRMSNPFAGIASIARGQSDAMARLDAQNAAVRRQNILQAMGARRELAGQKLSQQQYSQQRYMDAVNQANALKGAGMQNIFGGLSGIANVGLMGMQQPGAASSTQTMGSIYGNPSVNQAMGAGIQNIGSPNTNPLIGFPR